MRRGGAVTGCGAGVWLMAAAAHADPRARSVEVDGELGAVVFFPSAYRDSLRAFGQNGPIAGVQLAVRTLWGSGRARMGFRLGYLASPAPSAETLPDAALGATSVGDVAFHLLDVGWALRAVAWQSREPANVPMRFGVDVEAGLAVALTTWVRGTGVSLLPRLAVSTVLGLASPGPVQFGFRLGAQYIPSGGASGGSFWDPAFAGLTLGVELGGGR
jgi:hypothetical protein